MEDEAVGDPPSRVDRSGVKRGRSSLEQDASANRQASEKEKPAVPTTSQAGSRFVVLDTMDEPQDSDEIVPNTAETNVPVTAKKNGDGKRMTGDNRKQLQQGLQNVAQLANKGVAIGSSLTSPRAKHGPKVVASNSANKSPAVNIPNIEFNL
ncbi:RNA polymerase II-associated protein 1 [Corchorus olitorius]|uniref:RNA polymerase II-associated protein 1 n=1 Tax=Corchorus olitorius TaxID=93759 RepID=A0A1R3JMX5_9ROSI|nr:RNA polymerase II-associated protein 1 [Corchorus olitorius]